MNKAAEKIISNFTSGKQPITNIEDFIKRIRDKLQSNNNKDSNAWILPWFRGEHVTVDNEEYYNPLLPKLYRKNVDNNAVYNENKLLQHFRMKAPIFSSELVPERGETDKWLFLAQHVGLPTRLLDWTESAMVALYFALKDKKAAHRFVWMLDPFSLNQISINQINPNKISKEEASEEPVTMEFPLTWHNPEQHFNNKVMSGEWAYDSQDVLRFKPNEKSIQEIIKDSVGEWKVDENGDKCFYPKPNIINIGNINIRGAWEEDGPGTDFPVAILPTNIHPRMSVQRSCFTIHGKKKESLAALASEKFPEHLKCYMISSEAKHIEQMHEDLQVLGVTHSALFPDLDGLAIELQTLDYYKQ